MKFAAIGFTYFSLVPICGMILQNHSKFPVSQIDFNNFIGYRFKSKEASSLSKQLEQIKRTKLKVVIKTSEAGLEGVAGGTLTLKNGTKIYLDGSSVPVLWDLRDSLDLTLDIQFSNDWDEAWDMVAYGKTELGAPLRTYELDLVAKGALTKVIMLQPLVSMASEVYFREPTAYISGVRRYCVFKPLHRNAWIVLIFCWITCVLVCHTIHRFVLGPNQERSRGQYNPLKNFTISEVILWIATISSGKDYPVNSRDPGVYNTSVRIAMISAILLSISVTAIYTAKIEVYFAKEIRIIKKPDDLIRYGYMISSWSQVHIDRLFQKTELRCKRKDIELLDGHSISSSRETIMKKLLGIGNKNLRYAYLAHLDGFYFLDYKFDQYQTQLCKVSSFASQVKSPRSMYLKKDSKFKEVLNWKLLQMVERGINYRHQLVYRRLFEHNCHASVNPLEKLSLEHTFFPFVALIVGASIAFIIVLYEQICDRMTVYDQYSISYYILKK